MNRSLVRSDYERDDRESELQIATLRRLRRVEIVAGPTKVSGGVVARVIKEPNGSGRMEIWKPGKGWIDGAGKVTPDELMPGAGRPVSAADAARLGMPACELD